MRRKGAAAFIVAALLLLLIDVPSATTKIVVVDGPPAPPGPPVAKSVCDDVWAVPGFKPRYMVYDKVVNGKLRMGPEVKGRRMSEVTQELLERLCTDGALAIDLNKDYEGELGHMDKAYRTHWVETLTTKETEVITRDLLTYLASARANARIETYDGAYDSWHYVPGASPVDVPELSYESGIAPQHSTFLSFTAKDGGRHYWRLECGFQPTQLR